MKQLKGSVISLEKFNLRIFVQVFSILKEVLIVINSFIFLTFLLFVPATDSVDFLILWFGMNISILLFGLYKYHLLSLKIDGLIAKIIDGKIENVEEIIIGKPYALFEGQLRNLYLNKLEVINNLKRVEQFRTEFLGNVSHELRTPIFAMQGFLETLLNGALEDSNVNRVFLEKAFKHSQNLNNLLNDLIDISMIESGKMRMSFRYFDLSEFLKYIFQENFNIAKRKKLELKLNHSMGKTIVYGDQNRLKQVMNNLIQNAVKYTDNGFVEISTADFENKIEINIIDTGIGIPEEDTHRIFERFYRIDKNRSRAEGGTGLGLAIVKHILDAHGENIKVESKIGFGSKFSFFLRK